MSYKKWSRIIGFLLCISLTLCFESMVLQVNAAEKQGGRIINVVYDDSGSMVKTDDGKTIPRWSQAKYSLEVFTAMLNENDKMNIYPMSYQGSLGYTLTGKDKNRVKTVHDMNSSFSNTPFAAVQSAGQDLMNDSSGAEKWLVIITDGEFDDGATPKTTVQTTIDSYNARGIKVAYLAIGNDATVLDGDPASGFYTEKASDGVDVLKKVTSIANQIFEHLVLPDDYISGSNGKTTLTFDIPTKQIIVFAQGDNVKISDMQSNGQQIKAAEIENVKFSDVLPENYPDAVVDNSLKGVVATFESGNEPYSEGTFEISVTGAKTVEYYYSPGVVVNADLLYGDKPVNENAELYSGDYKVSMNFVNPLTGKKVESKLLSDVKFSLAVTNNGNKQVIDSDSGNMSLAEGDVELLALAQLPGQVELSDKKDYVVLPEPISLGLKTDKASYTYVANEIADQTAECILTATNEDSGELLSENEWNNTEIKVETKGGVEWKVEKGSEVSTWKLIPVSSDGTIENVKSDEYEFTVSADYQIDGQYAHGATSVKLKIEKYEGSPLIFETESVPGEYEMDNLDESRGFVVKAYIQTADKKKSLVSEDLWNNMSFEAKANGKVDLLVEKGSDIGTFIISPRYYKGKPLKTSDGTVQISYNGQVQDGERKYIGEDSTDITIKKLSTRIWIFLMMPYFIVLAVLVFIIIGYIAKKKIKTHGLKPHNIYKGKSSGKRKIKKNFWSVIIPYVDERAIVKCYNSGYECYFPNLHIKAVSKNGFKILNKGIDVKRIQINGERFTDAKELKKRTFTYSAFQITSIDPKSHNKKLGSFVFK